MPEKEDDDEDEDEEDREELLEDDEIDPVEEGFLEGYEGEGAAVCAECGKPLTDDSLVETEIDDEIVSFCSDKCLKKYEKKKR